jgi:site-specific recombinase XerD
MLINTLPDKVRRLPDLSEVYLLTCRAEGKSPYTLRWYKQKLDFLCRFLEENGLSLEAADLSPEIVRLMVTEVQATGVSPFTTRGLVQVIKGFYTWLELEGYLATNPLRRVKLPKTPKYVVRPLEEDEVSRILGAIDLRSSAGGRDLAIFLLLLDTGMRLGELARMSVEDGEAALRDGAFRVLGKGARERVLPIGLSTQSALARYLKLQRPTSHFSTLFLARDRRPLTAEGFRQVVRRLARRAGVGGVHPHKLRHTAAVSFLRGGGDVFALQRILGHSTLAMTRNYVTLTDRDVKAAHELASPADRFASSLSRGRATARRTSPRREARSPNWRW